MFDIPAVVLGTFSTRRARVFRVPLVCQLEAKLIFSKPALVASSTSAILICPAAVRNSKIVEKSTFPRRSVSSTPVYSRYIDETLPRRSDGKFIARSDRRVNDNCDEEEDEPKVLVFKEKKKRRDSITR